MFILWAPIRKALHLAWVPAPERELYPGTARRTPRHPSDPVCQLYARWNRASHGEGSCDHHEVMEGWPLLMVTIVKGGVQQLVGQPVMEG